MRPGTTYSVHGGSAPTWHGAPSIPTRRARRACNRQRKLQVPNCSLSRDSTPYDEFEDAASTSSFMPPHAFPPTKGRRPNLPPSHFSLQEWRTFRARLVALEKSGALSISPPSNTLPNPSSSSSQLLTPVPLSSKSSLLRPSPPGFSRYNEAPASPLPDGCGDAFSGLGHAPWAHALVQPEPGCLLLAKVDNMQFFNRAVVLITSHDEKKGSAGFILNKPSPLYVNELQCYSNSPGFMSVFGQQRLLLGGPVHMDHITLLHRFRGLERSHKIMDNLYSGGLPDAVRLVQAGLAGSHDFTLVLGMAGWGPHQLAAEVRQGLWHVAAASSDMVLPPKGPHVTEEQEERECQSMWRRILLAMQ